MPHRANPEHYRVLAQVVTVAEAARLCGVYRNTVIYAIDAGNIAAEKCGGVWLVSLASLHEWNETRLSKTA